MGHHYIMRICAYYDDLLRTRTPARAILRGLQYAQQAVDPCQIDDSEKQTFSVKGKIRQSEQQVEIKTFNRKET